MQRSMPRISQGERGRRSRWQTMAADAAVWALGLATHAPKLDCVRACELDTSSNAIRAAFRGKLCPARQGAPRRANGRAMPLGVPWRGPLSCRCPSPAHPPSTHSPGAVDLARRNPGPAEGPALPILRETTAALAGRAETAVLARQPDGAAAALLSGLQRTGLVSGPSLGRAASDTSNVRSDRAPFRTPAPLPPPPGGHPSARSGPTDVTCSPLLAGPRI